MPQIAKNFFESQNDSYRNWMGKKIPVLKQKSSISSSDLESAAFSTFAIASPFKFLSREKLFSQTAPGTSGAFSYALSSMKSEEELISKSAMGSAEEYIRWAIDRGWNLEAIKSTLSVYYKLTTDDISKYLGRVKESQWAIQKLSSLFSGAVSEVGDWNAAKLMGSIKKAAVLGYDIEHIAQILKNLGIQPQNVKWLLEQL